MGLLTRLREKKRRTQRLEQFQAALSGHPLYPLMSARTDLPGIRRLYGEGDPVVVLMVDRTHCLTTISPFLPARLLAQDQRLHNLLLARTEEPCFAELAALCVDVAAGAPATGWTGLFFLLENGEAVQGLNDLRRSGRGGLGPIHFAEYCEVLARVLTRADDVKSMKALVDNFVLARGVRSLISFVSRKASVSGEIIEDLVHLLEQAVEFGDPGHLGRGLALFRECGLGALPLPPQAMVRLGVRFARRLDRGVPPADLKAAASLIRNKELLADDVNGIFRRLDAFTALKARGVEWDLIRPVVHRLGDRERFLSNILLLELLLANADRLDPRAMKLIAVLDQASVQAWGEGQSHWDNSLSNLKRHLADMVADDDRGELLRLAGLIRDAEKDKRTDIFKAFIELCPGMTIGVVRAMNDLVSEGLEPPPKWDRNWKEFKRQCLERHLDDLLREGGYERRVYAARLEGLLHTCDDPEAHRGLLMGLSSCIGLGADLEGWLDMLLAARADHRDFLRSLDPGAMFALTLDEVRPFLRQYAVALAGNIPIREASDGVPCTDGRRVSLPALEARYTDSKENLFQNRNASLYVGNLLHEIGYHILAGSFLADFRPTLAAFSNRELAMNIFNIMEDFRGACHFRSQGHHRSWTDLLDEQEALDAAQMEPPSNWRDHFFQVLTCACCVGLTPGRADPDLAPGEQALLARPSSLFMPPDGRLVHACLGDVLSSVVKKIKGLDGKTVAHSLLMIRPVYQVLVQILGEDYHFGGGIQGSAMDLDSRAGRDAFAVSGNGNGSGRDGSGGDRETQLYELASRIEPHQKSSNVPKAVAEAAKRNGEKLVFTNAPGQDGSKMELPPGIRGTEKVFVGEYDHVVGREIKSQHQIVHRTISRRHSEFDRLYAGHRQIFAAVEEQVERLRIRKETTEMEGSTPDELIVENLVEGLADPRRLPFLDIYENEEERIRENLAPDMEVKILADASGSTVGPVLEMEKVFAAVLFRAFSMLGCDTNLYFFNSDRATHIIQPTRLEAMGHIDAGNANRDGAAIRYLTGLFTSVHAQRLFIIITDGMPAALNYFGEKALADTCHAMAAAGQEGVIIRYFNVGGLPKRVFKAFQEHTKQPRVFITPEDLVAHAPGFISSVLEELGV